MNEWTILIVAAWVESASNFFLTNYSNGRCSSSICGILACFSFLNFKLWLNFLIFSLESLPSLKSILISTISLFINFINYNSLMCLNFILVPRIPSFISIFHFFSIQFNYSFVFIRVSLLLLISIFVVSLVSLDIVLVTEIVHFFFITFDN